MISSYITYTTKCPSKIAADDTILSNLKIFLRKMSDWIKVVPTFKNFPSL